MNDLSHNTPDSPAAQPHSLKSWQEIDTSTPDGLRALDLYIARRLGWTNFREDDYFVEDWDRYDPAEDWFGNPPNDEYKSIVPHYSTNVNAALELIEEFKNRFTLCGDRDEWEVSIASSYNLEFDVIETATTPAIAICKAYLHYTDARQQPSADTSAEGGE